MFLGAFPSESYTYLYSFRMGEVGSPAIQLGPWPYIGPVSDRHLGHRPLLIDD